jgi:hypothetical protein
MLVGLPSDEQFMKLISKNERDILITKKCFFPVNLKRRYYERKQTISNENVMC